MYGALLGCVLITNRKSCLLAFSGKVASSFPCLCLKGVAKLRVGFSLHLHCPFMPLLKRSVWLELSIKRKPRPLFVWSWFSSHGSGETCYGSAHQSIHRSFHVCHGCPDPELKMSLERCQLSLKPSLRLKKQIF